MLKCKDLSQLCMKNFWVKFQLLPSAQLVDTVPDTKRTFVHLPLLWIWLSKERGVGRGSVQNGLTQNVCNRQLWQALCFNSILPSQNHVRGKMLTPKRRSWPLSLLLQSTNSSIKGLTVLDPSCTGTSGTGTPYDTSAVWLSVSLVLSLSKLS